ncbi:hypothetical protein M758_9G137200 [Ceratodon purpureus]|nr:hypothetical protein M758_9G137200 [Ceratodon purpureus]
MAMGGELDKRIDTFEVLCRRVDIRECDLEGWEVVLEETTEVVGRVEEVLSLASFWDPSVVEYCLIKVFDMSSPGIEYLIPWVEDVVKEVDSVGRRVFIKLLLILTTKESPLKIQEAIKRNASAKIFRTSPSTRRSTSTSRNSNLSSSDIIVSSFQFFFTKFFKEVAAAILCPFSWPPAPPP